MKKTAEERFWSFVNKTEICWEWIGGTKSNRYKVSYTAIWKLLNRRTWKHVP